jgi:hypothetical protein
MKDHDANRHPGPWKVMRGDTEFTGLLVAVGFIVMGLVSMPIATWFVLGTLVFGGAVALLLRFRQKKFFGVVVAVIILFVASALWWVGQPPRRPSNVSFDALYVEPTNIPSKFHRSGYWLDCRFDEQSKVDRCKLTDSKGNSVFEDVFLPCVGQTPLPQSELVLAVKWTGTTWTQSDDKRVNVPAVYLKNGQTLLPQSLFAKSRQDAGCSTS